MLLLISDANILIDMEAGGLLDKLFLLPMHFGIPDVLYWEEIEPGTPGLAARGLLLMEISSAFVQYAAALPGKHGTHASSNDYLALALAKQEACALLTGDRALKMAAEAEDVQVMGTVWLLQAMLEHQVLQLDEALAALALMKERNRRLPWVQAQQILGSTEPGA